MDQDHTVCVDMFGRSFAVEIGRDGSTKFSEYLAETDMTWPFVPTSQERIALEAVAKTLMED